MVKVLRQPLFISLQGRHFRLRQIRRQHGQRSGDWKAPVLLGSTPFRLG